MSSSLQSSSSHIARCSSRAAWAITPRRFSTGLVRTQPQTETATSASSSSAAPEVAPAPSSSTPQRPLSAALILSRQPTLLREPTRFERAYFAYNQKLRRALAQPFPREFYFKKGSAAEQRFDATERRRVALLEKESTAAGSVLAGLEAGKGDAPDAATQGQTAEQGAAGAEVDPDAELYATLPRRTAADEKGDVRSLERALDRTLFLLVRNGKEGNAPWRFPAARLDREGKENLHQAAPRGVQSILGRDMDLWLVGHAPVGFLPPVSADAATAEKVSAPGL